MKAREIEKAVSEAFAVVLKKYGREFSNPNVERTTKMGRVRMCKACAQRGMTRAETARHLNVTLQTIRNYADEYGINFNDHKRRNKCSA